MPTSATLALNELRRRRRRASRPDADESNVVLRPGQPAQHTSATDPVSGEVLRIDVTIEVLK